MTEKEKGLRASIWIRNFNTRILLLLCLSIGLVVSGCSSGAKDSQNEAAVVGNSNAVAPQAEPAVAEQESLSNSKSSETAYSDSNQEAADQAAGSQGNSGFTPGQAAEGWDRKVIFKGNLVMVVPDYAVAQTEISDLVALSGGYILQFSENQSTTENSGNYVIKVPANGFSSFIKDLEKIKTVSDIRQNIQGQDVSEEYVDLSSRLKAKQLVESRLLAFMEKAEKTADLLSFSNELGQVQEAIEQIKGRMRYLDQNVAMSTVEIRLYEQGVKEIANMTGKSTLTKTENALKGSLHALKVIAQGLIVVVAALLPIAVVLAIIAIPLLIVLRKRARKAALNPSPPANYVQKINTVDEEPK